MDTNEKVIEALKEQGRTKIWLAAQMQMSGVTLYTRLKSNAWRVGEILQLQKVLGIE